MVQSEAFGMFKSDSIQETIVGEGKRVLIAEAAKQLSLNPQLVSESYDVKYSADHWWIRLHLVKIVTEDERNAKAFQFNQAIESKIREAASNGATHGFIAMREEEMPFYEPSEFMAKVDKVDVFVESLESFCRAKIPMDLMHIAHEWLNVDRYDINILYVASCDLRVVYSHYMLAIKHTSNYFFKLGIFK
jgi:hypothetical protein